MRRGSLSRRQRRESGKSPGREEVQGALYETGQGPWDKSWDTAEADHTG